MPAAQPPRGAKARRREARPDSQRAEPHRREDIENSERISDSAAVICDGSNSGSARAKAVPGWRWAGWTRERCAEEARAAPAQARSAGSDRGHDRAGNSPGCRGVSRAAVTEHSDLTTEGTEKSRNGEMEKRRNLSQSRVWRSGIETASGFDTPAPACSIRSPQSERPPLSKQLACSSVLSVHSVVTSSDSGTESSYDDGAQGGDPESRGPAGAVVSVSSSLASLRPPRFRKVRLRGREDLEDSLAILALQAREVR